MLTLFFTFLMLGVAHAQHPAAPGGNSGVPLPPAEGHYEIKAEFDYFSTGGNYNTDSTQTNFISGGHYTTMDGLGQLTYDFSKQWRAYAGLDGGQSGADVLDNLHSIPALGYYPTNHNTVSGLNQAWLGGQWWLRKGDFDIVPEVDLTLPFWRVDLNYMTPLLGEGATQFQTGAWLRYQHWNEVTYLAYLGYDYRDGGRAGIMPWDVGARYELPQFYVEGDVRGFWTVITDAADRGVRDVYLNQTDAGSYENYAINPNRAEVAALAGVRMGPFEIYGGGLYTFWGQTSAAGWGAQIGVKFSGSLYKADNGNKDQFQEPPEKYDDSVFKEGAPVTPDNTVPDVQQDNIYQQQQQSAPAPAPKKKKVKKKHPNDDSNSMPNVEQLMKETEKSLEKKGK